MGETNKSETSKTNTLLHLFILGTIIYAAIQAISLIAQLTVFLMRKIILWMSWFWKNHMKIQEEE
jgi:hypothetical protein